MGKRRDLSPKDEYRSPDGTRYRRVGAHETGPEDPEWFNRPRPRPKAYVERSLRGFSLRWTGFEMTIVAALLAFTVSTCAHFVDASEALRGNINRGNMRMQP